MPTLERKLTIRRDLAQRANRKLHRYGRTLDDAINGALMYVVSSHGLPDFVEREPVGEMPNAETRAAFAEAERQIKDPSGWLPLNDFLSSLHDECAR